MNVAATVKMSSEDCLEVLEHEMRLSGGGFPPAKLVRRLQNLHTHVMERWIAPADRCSGCGGSGGESGGNMNHPWICPACAGTGRRKS